VENAARPVRSKLRVSGHAGVVQTDQCATAIKTIRNIGTLRQGAQHSSPPTRANALRAQTGLGLPMVVTDYPAAWATLLDKLAGAFYSICLGITLQPEAADGGASS